MTVYHLALFKAKESMTADDGTTLVRTAKAMLEHIPGLVAVEVGPALEVTKASAPPYVHGYDWSVILTLANREALRVYMTHPVHDEILKVIGSMFTDDVLLFDFEV